MNEILISFRRTPYQSLSAFLVLFLVLFLSIVILFSSSFLSGLLSYVETRPQVTVYFRTQTPENDIFKVREALISSGKVLSIKYISKNEAFKIYQQLNKDNPLLLEMVTPDILPASLEIYAKKPGFLPEIAEFLKKQVGVDEVDFQKIIIDRLLTLTNIVRKIFLIFFGYLILMAVVILMTLTHFKVALKKDEIELLRLLGANTFYIKKPFLFEALFSGFLSAIASFIVFLGILYYFNSSLRSYLGGIGNLSLNLNWYQISVWPINPVFLTIIFLLTVFFGATISVIASLLATQKYIK